MNGKNSMIVIGKRGENMGLDVRMCVYKSVPVTGPVVAQSLGRGIALNFHDRGTRRG